MKIHNHILVAAVLMVVSTGCRAPYKTVTSGTYIDNRGTDYIQVNGSNMLLHTESGFFDTTNEYNRKCEYDLWPDGRIMLIFDRSVEYFIGMGRADCYWDGSNIIVVEPDNHGTNIFRRASDATPK